MSGQKSVASGRCSHFRQAPFTENFSLRSFGQKIWNFQIERKAFDEIDEQLSRRKLLFFSSYYLEMPRHHEYWIKLQNSKCIRKRLIESNSNRFTGGRSFQEGQTSSRASLLNKCFRFKQASLWVCTSMVCTTSLVSDVTDSARAKFLISKFLL